MLVDRITISNAGLVTLAGALTVTGVLTANAAVALGSQNLTMTGTISATGARVTQSYHTNLTSTNAVTVDSSETVKHDIAAYKGDALGIVAEMDVITFRHDSWLDPSGALKLGVRGESVREPLALDTLHRDGVAYPGVNIYGLEAILTRAVQQLIGKVTSLEAKLA